MNHRQHIGYFLLVSLLLFLVSCSGAREYSYKPKQTLSKAEAALVLSGDADTPMRVLLTTSKEDSLFLRQKSRDIKVNPNDETLQLLVKRMYRTMRDSSQMGIGLAAPQIGIAKNIIWVQRFDKPDSPFEVYFNPKILQYSEKKQSRREGCLSIPNFRGDLDSRAYAILVEYQRFDRSKKIEMIEGLAAIVFQHEMDHLNGVLFVDYLE